MRRVFQYMASVALCCVALVSSCQRLEFPEQETLPSQLQVNFTIGFDASDTRAVKTAWEDGDVVFIFFNAITTNGNGQAKYLKLTWNSGTSSWTSTPMGGLTASDLAAAAAKSLTAVYLPFSGNVTVNYHSSKGFTFDPFHASLFWHSQSVGYALEASATDLNTTVLSLLDVGDHLAMAVPDGFIQFFLDDADATAQAASDMYITVSHVVAGGLESIYPNGAVNISSGGSRLQAFVYDKENKASGENKGYLFSGMLSNDCKDKNIQYRMSLKANGQKYVKTTLARFYRSESAGRAIKVPALEEWTLISYVDGVFSVSPSKKVSFAKGNVVVEYTNVNGENHREWMIAPKQYSIYYGDPTHTVPVVPAGTTVYLDHFRWATAGVKNQGGDYGADPGHTQYQSNSCEYRPLYWGDPQHPNLNWNPTVNPDLYNLYGIGPSGNSDVWSIGRMPTGAAYSDQLDADNTWLNDWDVMRYCDWGVHFDVNGTGYDTPPAVWGGWHTLSASEWRYLLQERPYANTKYGVAAIYDAEKQMHIYGVVFLPDEFTLPTGCAFNSGNAGSPLSGWQDRVKNKNCYYTGEDASKGPSGSWSDMEESGAVFLPATGLGTISEDGRYGTNTFSSWVGESDDDENGYYVYGVEYYGTGYAAPDAVYWSSSAGNEEPPYSGEEDPTDFMAATSWTWSLGMWTDYNPSSSLDNTSRTFFECVRLVMEVQ